MTAPNHEFLPVAGHPDDDECTHREDGTDSTYCGLPESQHSAPVWDESHEVFGLDEGARSAEFCELCEICACHSPELAVAPCPAQSTPTDGKP